MFIEEFQLTALRIGEGPISVLPLPGGRVLWLVEGADDADVCCSRAGADSG